MGKIRSTPIKLQQRESMLTSIPDLSWLPRPSIRLSVESLPNGQLNRVWDTSYHTLRTLVGCRNPLSGNNIKLWKKSETALANYTYHVMFEQRRRHIKVDDLTILQWDLFWALVEDGPRDVPLIRSRFIEASTRELKKNGLLPKWFGWKPLHESHRKALDLGDPRVRYPWKT